MATVTANFLHFSPSALSVKPHKPATQTCPYLPFCNRRPGGSSISASNNRTKSSTYIEEHDSDVAEEDEEEDDEMVVIPFREMKRWFENRPKGFGEGKDYDTSLEETLWQEIEQSKKAQIANINKLKSGSAVSSPKREKAIGKATECALSGIPVRLDNLPKKKNIHRDLGIAFKGFPGINHISPAVSGSKKTRDPICRGFAFIYLESEEAAHRFVEAYSRTSIKFGKVEKQITCAIEIPNASPNSYSGQSADEKDMRSDADEILWDSKEESSSEESDDAILNGSLEISGELINVKDAPILHDSEDIEAGFEKLNISDNNKGDNLRMGRENDATKDVDSPTKPKQNNGVMNKNRKAPEKGLNLRIPGSAKRLKIREKIVFTGAFSKYGRKSSSALPVDN
ncbi:uncharacterized protein [Aristolochia californica]|uniref:uncharacterized protein n=1 Tax=Aristolochia californica TaxID=171875 RepID=UPI0035E020F9